MELKSKLKGFKIVATPSPGFTLITPLFISTLFLPISFLIIIAYAVTIKDTGPYVFAFSVVFIGLSYRVWYIFDPINIIIADTSAHLFRVRPRNLLKRIFFKETIFPFQEIKEFIIQIGSDPPTLESDRYIITAIQKDSSKAAFTHSTNKEMAHQVLDLMQQTLRGS